jgi:hypothetical protein
MKNRIDILIVIVGMITGFIVILMHLTGLWPCAAMSKFEKLFLSNNPNNTTTIKNEVGPKNNFIDGIYYLLVNLFRCK